MGRYHLQDDQVVSRHCRREHCVELAVKCLESKGENQEVAQVEIERCHENYVPKLQ